MSGREDEGGGGAGFPGALWREVAAEQDLVLAAAARPDGDPILQAAKRRLHEAGTRPIRAASPPWRERLFARSSRWPRWQQAAALLLLPGAIAAVIAATAAPALTVRVDDTGTTIADGEELVAPSEAGLPLRFSDGSAVDLAAGGRARIMRLRAHGATVQLFEGTAHADIVHRDGTDWTIAAGPFSVRVTGTSFVTSFAPQTGVLVVQMLSGSVRVAGGPLHEGLTLRQGQRLRVSARDGQVAVTPFDAVRMAEAVVPPAVPAGVAPAEPAAAGTPPSRPPDAPTPAAPTGRGAGTARANSTSRNAEVAPLLALAQSGRHAEALALAHQLGFERLCGALAAPDLLLLGDVARHGGEPRNAQRAFERLNTRFPAAPEAADAVFGLGRLTFDAGDPVEAARRFGQYAEQWPDGPLLEQALGRRLEAWLRAGRTVDARKAADHYLRQFPRGIYAGAARGAQAP